MNTLLFKSNPFEHLFLFEIIFISGSPSTLSTTSDFKGNII